MSARFILTLKNLKKVGNIINQYSGKDIDIEMLILLNEKMSHKQWKL